MAPQAIKRRKLSHDIDLRPGASPFEGQQNISDEPLTNSSDRQSTSGQVNAPMAGQMSKTSTGRYDHHSDIFLAGEAHKSSMFKLQMEELLAEIRPKHAHHSAQTERVLRKLKATIESFPQREPLSVAQAEKVMRKTQKISIPFPEPTPTRDIKYTLTYMKPSYINVVGSYALKNLTSLEEDMAIDLAITMPPGLFQEKDFMNYRYFYKRAYYMACLAAGLQETSAYNYRLSFEQQHGNPLLPVLVMKSGTEGGEDDFTESKCIIRIIAAIPDDLFPKRKTWPNKQCIRPNSPKDDSTFVSSNNPTPFYNATLRSEGLIGAYVKLLHQASTLSEAFKDVCLLGRVWLRQRGLGKSIAKGGFGPFEWAALCAALLEGGGPHGKPVLAYNHDNHQLFKSMLQFIASKNLTAIPDLSPTDDPELSNSEIPVFFDGPRAMNILYKMSPWSYSMLRHEARVTLDMLDDPVSSHFDSIFMTRPDEPLHRFDSLIRLSVPTTQITHQRSLDQCSAMGDFCHKLYKILRTALSDRVTLIYLSFPETEGWELRAKTHTPIILSYLVVGLLINPNHVSRLVDHGPSAEDKKAAFTFRQFWGEKAELRRFKDGSILESLIWSEEESKSSILQQITSYSLHRHFGKDVANTLSFIGDSFDHLLPDNDNNSAQSLEQFRHLITAFAHLEQDIRALDGLPLEIRRLSAVSPESRYSSFRAPFSAGNGDGSNPMDVTAQFESSARWPDDFIAVQRTKIAFLLKIGELLEEAVNGVMTRLGLENESHTFLNASFLDITYTTGITFRLRVHHDREQTLLERQLRKVSLDPRHRHLTSMALSTYKRDFLQLPLHADSMRTLCTSFPFLSPTVRLMKKWCNGHLLTTHVSEELLEILVVRTFVQPYPWRAPASVMAGFLRTLRFISAWDWRNEPLILTFSGALDPKEKDAIELRFQAWRKLDPAMNRVVMFAASNLDPSGVSWTENGPSKVVAERLVSLATAVCTLVKQQGLGIDPATLFTSSLMDYDFVIHLSTNVTRKARTGQKRTAQFKNLQSQSSASAHLTGYNPAELFLDELKIIYGNAIVFFYDGTDGDIIAGLWNPQTGSRQWKVNLAYSTAPLVEERGGDEARIGLNKDAILNDIARLGGDLMERIVANR